MFRWLNNVSKQLPPVVAQNFCETHASTKRNFILKGLNIILDHNL